MFYIFVHIRLSLIYKIFKPFEDIWGSWFDLDEAENILEDKENKVRGRSQKIYQEDTHLNTEFNEKISIISLGQD